MEVGPHRRSGCSALYSQEVHWIVKDRTGSPSTGQARENPLGHKQAKADGQSYRGSLRAVVGVKPETCSLYIGRAAGWWSTQKRVYRAQGWEQHHQMSLYPHTTGRACESSILLKHNTEERGRRVFFYDVPPTSSTDRA